MVIIDEATTKNLVDLLTHRKSASDALNEAVAGVHEKLGIPKPVIRAYAKAIYDVEIDAALEQAEILQMLLRQ